MFNLLSQTFYQNNSEAICVICKLEKKFHFILGPWLFQIIVFGGVFFVQGLGFFIIIIYFYLFFRNAPIASYFSRDFKPELCPELPQQSPSHSADWGRHFWFPASALQFGCPMVWPAPVSPGAGSNPSSCLEVLDKNLFSSLFYNLWVCAGLVTQGQ